MKKYSTPNLVKAVSLGTVIATLLSSVSPILAANLAITGGKVESTNEANVSYQHASHGSIVFAGDDNYCGVDNAVGRGGKQQQGMQDGSRITAEEQYNRFVNDQEFEGYQPDGVYPFVTGCVDSATANYSAALSAGATTKAGTAQALRVSARSSRAAGITVGEGSVASGTSAIAIGENAKASGKKSISIGESSQATMDDAIAIGSNTDGSGINSVAIGKFASASGYNSVALGLRTNASAEYTVAIGSKAQAQALGSIAIGGGEPADNGQEREVIAKGKNSIAIGSHTYAEMAHSVAIGINAQVRVIDGVAVGGGSVSRVGRDTFGYDPVTNNQTTKSDLAWKSTGGDFSVGNTNQQLTRQITNVAAGTQDTDAVNVAQLKALRNVIAGGGAGGSWNISVNDSDSTAVNEGNTVDFSVKNASEAGKDNLKIEREGENNNKHNIKFALSDTLKLTSVTTGNSSMSKDGFVITGGPSMAVGGIKAGSKKITEVAEGTVDTDAVNYKQLKDFTTKIKTGWKLAVENNEATDIGAGSTVKFVAAADEDSHKNINIEKDENNNVTFGLADDIQVMTVTAGESIMSASGFRFTDDDGPSITVKGIHAGNKTIKGVAAGEEDTDAVNFGQLKAMKDLVAGGWKLSVNGANPADVKGGSVVDFSVKNDNGVGQDNLKIEKDNENKIKFALSDTLKLTSVTTGNSSMSSDGFMITDGPSVKSEGISAGDKKITGVMAGTNNTDAVNYSQLKEIENQIAGNNLVEWDEEKQRITIGAKKNGTKIDITSTDGVRTIAGVKAAVNGNEAVNKDQLDESIEKISKDALLWSDEDQAFVAQHKEGEALKDSKIMFLLDGEVSAGSTEAINGGQLYSMGSNIANYFGGGAGYNSGKWNGPTFEVYQIDSNGTGSSHRYQNVADAFEGVNTTFTKIHNQISNIAGNNLVEWDEDQKLITIGAKKDGTKIDITSTDGARTIAGVKAAEKGNEAVNKDQLDGQIAEITNTINNINKGSDFAVLYDKNGDNSVNYNSVTLGGGKANGQVALRNVKDGEISEQSHDAVNGSQIEKISKDVAKFFGGNASFEKGTFTKPRYNLTIIDENSKVKQKEYNDVGSALSGLDMNIRHVNQHLVHAINDVATYFGGGAGYDEKEEWHAPIFNVIQFRDDGTSSKQPYDNVADAFEGVNSSFTNIHNQISNIKENNLVKWDENQKLITIGKEKGGAKIDIKGSEGDRTIAGVKAGTISANSTEAINGSQINTISGNIAQYFGGGAKFENGAYVGPKYSLSVVCEDGTVGIANYRDVGTALTGLDANVKSVNTRITNVVNNFTEEIQGLSKDALLWSEEDKAFVARHEKDGKKTNSKLTSLLNGEISENSTDAITGKQLYFTTIQLANYFGGGAGYDQDGNWNGPNFMISQINANGTVGEKKSYNNVADALDGVNSGMVNINNRIDDVINKVDSDALKWNKEKGAYDASHNGQPSKIINVADGTIAEGSKDAVNGGQLWKTNERVAGVEKDIKHIENKVDNIENTVGELADGVVLYDKDNNGKKTNKITLKGGDASEPVLIDNVADGKIEKGSKEAVNGGQLRDYTEQQMKIILDESKHYTDQRVNNIVVDAIDNAVERANQYTNMKFEALNYSIENVRKEAKQAAAIGLAVSNLRYNDTPGKLSVAFGSGLWRSQSAFAFGAGYTSEKGNIRSNLSVTSSGGHWGVGAGLNMTLN
ncbi:Vomp family autotransporter [Bartonella vinsonii]|uniref:Adhesin yadA n=1 Tax=Bartonella vinsonii TaxID=33047 RepID=A0A3S4ZBL9_BARVI|nr:Vomp family autotransporter [Bartonella vinsonii]VEJ44746.1 Adhesin yadA precursor [Bartonella vinsonii]